MNLNRVELSGGLVKDPEVRMIGQAQTTLVELSVALNGTKYDRQQRGQVVKTTFVVVQCWGWVGEQVASYGLTRGQEVYVLGELDQTEVERPDGSKDRKTRINASLVFVTRAQTRRGPYEEDPWH